MADLMHRFFPSASIWIPEPTWANHHKCALTFYITATASLD